MTAPDPSSSSDPTDPSDSPGPSDPADLAARLDRITYLLVALLVVQLVALLDLGPAGLVLFLVVGLYVTALSQSRS